MHRRYSRFPVMVIMFMVTMSCASHQSSVLTDRAVPYHPVRITSDVPARPGNISWSPDGKALAFVKDGTVHLYEPPSADIRSIGLPNTRAVTWSPAGPLLALVKENDQAVLYSIDRESLEMIRTAVDPDAAAMYASPDSRFVYLLSYTMKKLSYGTEVFLRISSLTGSQKTPRLLYSFSRTYPVDKPDLRALLAWTHAGLHPVDSSLLIMEHMKPPAVAPYSRVIMLDPASTEVADITGRARHAVYISADWSPDGKKIALTRSDGTLDVRSLSTGRIEWEQPIAGFYPAWSPVGNRLFIGGKLITADGSVHEMLFTNAAWSLAAWSPDGTALAVATGEDLWVFGVGVQPTGPSPDMTDRDTRNKVLLLQDLLRDGLITREEYRERKQGLLMQQEAR